MKPLTGVKVSDYNADAEVIRIELAKLEQRGYIDLTEILFSPGRKLRLSRSISFCYSEVPDLVNATLTIHSTGIEFSPPLIFNGTEFVEDEEYPGVKSINVYVPR